ncbi:hypothetical protein [Caldivirga sp.]|uniref:hypothetical protein n=1 Tax=Caldivirga sp. TaxID=2080243 RepID=UPI003D117DEC
MEVEALVFIIVVGLVLLAATVVVLMLSTSLTQVGSSNQLREYNALYCNGTLLKPTTPGIYNCPPCLIYYYNNTVYSDCPS